MIPLYGHDKLRARLLERIRKGAFPQSLLLHGAPGVGKQRLALWLGQALLCSSADAPCGSCRHCRYMVDLTHPDLLWVFPRPRPKDTADTEDVAYDLSEARMERAAARGLYAAPPSAEAIFVSTIRVLAHQASRTPALAARKVFVVGDADRMVVQEGSEFAANAFLKLLEEPPANTWIIATTSAVGALLPTIRSRVVAVRVPYLDEASLRAFVGDPDVTAALDKLGLPDSVDDRLALAQGAPGKLLSTGTQADTLKDARRFLAAALAGKRQELLRLALVQGHRGARGTYSDILDALTFALHQRMRDRAQGEDSKAAGAAGRAIDLVEEAKRLAEANVSPQLISARLLEDLAATLA